MVICWSPLLTWFFWDLSFLWSSECLSGEGFDGISTCCSSTVPIYCHTKIEASNILSLAVIRFLSLVLHSGLSGSGGEKIFQTTLPAVIRNFWCFNPKVSRFLVKKKKSIKPSRKLLCLHCCFFCQCPSQFSFLVISEAPLIDQGTNEPTWVSHSCCDRYPEIPELSELPHLGGKMLWGCATPLSLEY